MPKAYINTALAIVMIREQIAGPIMKRGAGFSGRLFSFPNEMASHS